MLSHTNPMAAANIITVTGPVGSMMKTVADVQRISMPHFYWTHLLNTAALGQLDHPDAPAALAQLFEVKPTFSAQAELQKWNAAPHDLDHLVEGLRKAGLSE